MLNSTIVIVIMGAAIVLLLAATIYLNISFYHEKKQFKDKLGKLRLNVSESNKKQSNQRDKIQLAQDIDQSIKKRNAVLGNQIFELSQELFKILSKNNLLKK